MKESEYTENINLNVKYSALLQTQLKINYSDLSESPEDVQVDVTSDDYESNYITRYFARKKSDENSRITEIDISQFRTLSSSYFYRVIKFKWKISGSLNTIYEGNIKKEIGVVEHNTEILNKMEKILRGVKNKITSVTQFYKN
jgi:hypothetical protein